MDPQSVSIEDLTKALVAALAEAGINQVEPEDPNRLFTPDELAVMFGLTRSTIYKLRLSQNWPHHLLGGAIRFSRQDIDAIIASTAKTPEPPRRSRSRLK